MARSSPPYFSYRLFDEYECDHKQKLRRNADYAKFAESAIARVGSRSILLFALRRESVWENAGHYQESNASFASPIRSVEKSQRPGESLPVLPHPDPKSTLHLPDKPSQWAAPFPARLAALC